ncbi:AMP-binding protein, partial [Acrocarpospora corrugata]|uniref:AMP-binding protein n=1 Tax=Acrocarpospora corrugata TaxID=35763 RepID=UPI0012D34BE6
APFADDVAVHQLVEERAARSPLAVAVSCDGQSLTYGRLNARANQLARLLRERGAAPETLVAVCVERGVDLVVALLAILKSGAAYLPLDPEYPAGRLRFMLEDSRAGLVITHSSLRGILDGADVQQIVLDQEQVRADIATRPDSDLPPLAGPGDLAYIMYTSGSTGTPKAVMI